QIDGEIKALGREALLQLAPVLLRALELAAPRDGVKEVELDRAVDIRLQRPYRPRGVRRQNRDARVGKMPLQAADRRKRDDAVADVVELDDENAADVVAR